MDRARWLRHLRGGLVLVAIVANLISSLPYGKIEDEDRTDPEYRQADLDLWWAWLGALLPTSRETFDRTLRAAFFLQEDATGVLRWPFEWYYDFFHINQHWNLFAVVGESHERLVIEVRRGGDDWGVLYRRLDPEHDWHQEQLRYRRIRGVWDNVGKEPKGTYKRMSKWIAVTVFTELPEVDRVRVLLEQRPVAAPWEPLAEEEEVERRAERYFRRHEVMK